jgi:hypothetical protein
MKENFSVAQKIATDEWLLDLFKSPTIEFKETSVRSQSLRIIRLDEINEEKHQAYRQALANIYSTLDPEVPVRFFYLLESGGNGVSLYFGVVADATHANLLHEAMKNLRGALEGQLPGINFDKKEVTGNIRDKVIDHILMSPHQGVMLGAPTTQEQNNASDEQDFQGVDRLVRSLKSSVRQEIADGANWRLAVVSQPFARQEVRLLLDSAYTLSSKLTGMVRTSVQTGGNSSHQKSISTGRGESKGDNTGSSKSWGKNEGGSETKNSGTSSSTNSSSNSSGKSSGTSQTKSLGTSENLSTTTSSSTTKSSSENFSFSDTESNTFGVTQEISNKRAQHLVDYIDKQLVVRLQKGLTKGLFHTAVYFAADDISTYQRLKNTLRATFQGSESTMSPLEVYDLPRHAHGQLLCLPMLSGNHHPEDLLFHSLCAGAQNTFGSFLTADELAIVASLPQHELQGIRRRKIVNFIVDLPDVENPLDLGRVIDRGRQYPNNRICLARADLNKHIFVTGVTGAGKTTTCLNLLLESKLPFLVIEPAKTEYRELAVHLKNNVDYYRPNGDEHQSLRINPFALISKTQRIKSHAGFLKNVFAAVFPMEASMPMMVEAAILAAYEEKGWDLDDNEFIFEEDPFAPIARAWPTMSDMIRQLDRLIPTYGLGPELEAKYRGSLVSRLRSLTDGTLGRVLDVTQSIDFPALLTRQVVIELEELQGGEEKALLMALLLGGLNEAIRIHYNADRNFRHLTLIEEAHRLLSRPEPGDKAAALAVESFADMLAEVRKYGAGLIIADQIPAKLIPDVIKNTHIKIVHRLFAEDDRRAMGESMMMDEHQRNFLPNLGIGEAIVFCGGWHGPAHAAIRKDRAQTDNHAKVDMVQRYTQQLWHERKRYYPQFCQLNWLSTEIEDPTMFASFVRGTRQAQNQFLQIITLDMKQNSRVEAAFKRLKAWQQQWQMVSTRFEATHEIFCTECSEKWPKSLLAAAWMALLLDANPRANPQEKAVLPLQVETRTKRAFLIQVIEFFLRILDASTHLSDFRRNMQGLDAADFQDHCNDLRRFKSF